MPSQNYFPNGAQQISQAIVFEDARLKTIANMPDASVRFVHHPDRTDAVESMVWDANGNINIYNLSGVYNVQGFGAKGDGVTDDTAAIQAAITAATSGTRTGSVYFPHYAVGSTANATYLITAKLTYTGTLGTGLTLYSSVRPGATPRGARLLWAGAAGGTMFESSGGNAMLFQNLAFDGGGLALYGINMLYGTAGSIGSANNAVDKCWLGGFAGVDSAAIRCDSGPFQVSEVRVMDSLLVGFSTPGTTYYGFLAEGGSNVKNFVVQRCSISGFRYGVCHGKPTVGGGSGYMVVRDNSFALQTVSDVYGFGGNLLTISGGGSEGSAMLYTCHGSGGSAFYPIKIEDFYWDGTAAADDVIILPGAAGMLKIINCSLFNRRTGASLPRIQLNPAFPVSLISLGNFYFNADTYLPVYDGGGTLLLPSGAGRIYSRGDMGGTVGTALVDIERIGGPNLQRLSVKTVTELTTIAAAATTDTTILMPASAIILGVSVRVTTVIPTAATFTVGDSGSATRFSTAAVSTAANSTDPGTAAGAYYNAAALAVRITPNAPPAANTGRVRVTIHYLEITPPSS